MFLSPSVYVIKPPYIEARNSFQGVANSVSVEEWAFDRMIIDAMHPTGCGCAVVASWTMTLLNLQNNDLAKLVEQSFIDDSLVHDVPLKLDLLIAVLAELQRILLCLCLLSTRTRSHAQRITFSKPPRRPRAGWGFDSKHLTMPARFVPE